MRFGLIFLLEFIDNTIRSKRSAEQLLGYLVLGSISKITKKTHLYKKNEIKSRGREGINWNLNRKSSNVIEKISLIAAINQNSKISEQYRTFRTNFLSTMNGLNSQTLIVTSPNRKEGKSTAANFAISLAQQGKKVLLIDADFRNSTLSFSFEIDNSIGLSNVLVGNILLEDAIDKTEY